MNLQDFFEGLDGEQRRVRQLPADFRPADTSPQLSGPYPGRNATQGYLVGEDQDMAEGHADQQRKIFKKNGQPVGEVGIDRESSPGVGQYYMKHYASGTDNSGYKSRKEAVKELRHLVKQGVAEGMTEASPDWRSKMGFDINDPSGNPLDDPEDRGLHRPETFVTSKGNRYTYILGGDLYDLGPTGDEMLAQIRFKGIDHVHPIQRIHLQYDPNMQAFDPENSWADDPILDIWLKRQRPFGSDEDSLDDFVDRAVAHVFRPPGQGVSEGSDDIWGPAGRFAGDEKTDIGMTLDKISVGDQVQYHGRKVRVKQLYKDRARVSDGSREWDVPLSDLNRLGQGVREGSKIAVDRKTGRYYDPDKELDKLLNQHKTQFQGMAAIEKAQSSAKKAKPKKPDVQEAGVTWHGTQSGREEAAMTDHTVYDAKQYLKANYPVVKTYNVRRAEPGFRILKRPDELRKSEAHIMGVDGAVDYLQLERNAMMSGSSQWSASIGSSWSVYENTSNGIAIIYYQDRGMGSDSITVAGKTPKIQAQARQVFIDAGVLPEPKPRAGRSVDKQGGLREFDAGESGFGPWRLYQRLDPYSKPELIGEYDSLAAAEDEMQEQIFYAAQKNALFYYDIIDGTDERVGGFDPDESADSLRRSRKIQGLEESGWNPLDDERREQRAMDQERRQFKRDELEAELAGEEERYRQIMRGTWYVVIDGRAWQRQGQPVTFQGREAARRAAQTIKNRDPNKTVGITQALPTTEQTDPRQRLAQMRAQTQSSLQAMRANAQAGRDRLRGGAPAPAAAPPAASPGRARKTNAAGVTQHDWMAQARQQGARLIQAKMIDGPVIAIYSDGRRDVWQPVGESVSESVKQHHFIYETHERMFEKWDREKEREKWEAQKTQYVQQAMARDEQRKEYERRKKEKEAEREAGRTHAGPQGQHEYIAPHGDARSEVAMFRAGTKPAALINSPDVGIWSDLINSGRYVLQRLKLAGQPDSYVIGQPGEEERVEKIHALVQNANDRAQQGDFSPFQNSNYHRWLGRLLGYPASKIEKFIANYFRDTPDRAQARYDEGQALQEIQHRLSQQIAAEDVLGGMRQRLGDMIQAKAAQRARQMARRQPPQDILGDPVRRIDLGDGKILEIHGSEDDGFRIYRGTRGMPTRFRTLDEAMMAADLYEGWRDTLPEKKDPDLRRTARSTRIMQQLRARHPEAQNDIEALLYYFRAGQAQDRRDITRLDIELDDEEAEIDRIQADLNRLMRARKLDANIQETKKDACYQKVKSRYRVWPSAYASGALVQCRKQGARNWGTGKK